MSDIELVVKIPERIHYGIEKGITVNGSKASQILIDAVKNGTPLPQGHWIFDGDCLICSKCKKAYSFSGSNFCPNCGADMREVDNGNND